MGAELAYPLTPRPRKAGKLRPNQGTVPGDTAQPEHRRPQLPQPGARSTEHTGNLRPVRRRGAQMWPAARPTHPRQPKGHARPGPAPQQPQQSPPHPELGPGIGGSSTCTSGSLARASGMTPAPPGRHHAPYGRVRVAATCPGPNCVRGGAAGRGGAYVQPLFPCTS